MFNKILCVDDDAIALMLCKLVISKVAFTNEIITAKNGQEALEFYTLLKINTTVQQPELVFLDLNMPILDGWEFLEQFNTTEFKEFHQTKVIILSSTIDPEDVNKSKQYPMVVDFLSKPISKEMLEYVRNKFQLNP